MTLKATSISAAVGTVGVLQSQVRQLLKTTHPPHDADKRPAAFSLERTTIGELPATLDCRGYFDLDILSDAVLVLVATDGKVALYLVVNMNDRAALAPLAAAVVYGRVELMVAGPDGTTSHELSFLPSEARRVQRLMSEYLDLGLPCDADWPTAVNDVVVPRLAETCEHLNPALSTCHRHVAVVLQGSYYDHLRAINKAVVDLAGR